MANTIAGANADLEVQLQKEMDRKQYLVDRMGTVNDEAELALMQSQIEAQDVVIAKLQTTRVGVDVASKAIGTDWRNPAESAPWLAAGVSALVAALQNKKQRNVSSVLKLLQQGVNTHMAKTSPEDAERLRSRINSYVASPVM